MDHQRAQTGERRNGTHEQGQGITEKFKDDTHYLSMKIMNGRGGTVLNSTPQAYHWPTEGVAAGRRRRDRHNHFTGLREASVRE